MDDAEGEELHAEIRTLRERIGRLEQQLGETRGASAFLESTLAAVPAFITNLDPDLKIRFLNRYQAGHSFESVVGTDVFDYIAPEDRALALERIELARRTGQITSYTVHKAVGADNAHASYLTRVAPVYEPDGRVGACLAFLDITEEIRRERKLQELQAQLNIALDATGLGLWSWDSESNQSIWDDRMTTLHGGSAPLDLDSYADRLVHPEDRERVRRTGWRAFKSGSFPPTSYRILWPDGSQHWLLAVGKIYRESSGKVMLMGGMLDITRERDVQEQLRKAQKIEALASLTAGVAHNFNNMLAVIMPVLELSLPLVPAPQQKLLQNAAHAARRASELVRQLMTYAGQSKSEPRVRCDVDKLVNSAVSICERTFGPQIALEVALPAEPLFVSCSPGQIEQVLVNLLINARDAVEESANLDKRVRVRVRFTEGARPPNETSPPPARVCIDVIDNGVGMTEQARAHLFDPFFTTKGVGKGTGLGLATSFAIAGEHEGSLTCEATGPDGTQFTLALPIATEDTPNAAEPIPEVTSAPEGTQVLLVDDDEAVRQTLLHVLQAYDLVVREASSGSAALEMLRAHPSTEVVLLDRSMPGGSGERFVPAMRELCPRARIILLSGRAVEPEITRIVDAAISKPVTGAKLVTLIQRVLASETRAAP